MPRISCDRCYNPFKYEHRSSCKGLRSLSDYLQKKFVSIPKFAKICTDCRKEMANLSAMSPLYILDQNNAAEIEEVLFIELPLQNL